MLRSNVVRTPHQTRFGWSNRGGRWAMHMVRKGIRKYVKSFGEETWSKRLLARSRHTGKNNLKLDLKESGWDGVIWIHLSQDRAKKRAAVNTIMDLRFPQHMGNFLSRWWTTILSRTLLHVVSLLVSQSPRTTLCKISAECRAVHNKFSGLKNTPSAVHISTVSDDSSGNFPNKFGKYFQNDYESKRPKVRSRCLS